MTEPVDKPPPPAAAPDPETATPKVVLAEQLFQGCREIVIDHAGARYRLRITRRGKLILQK